MNIPDKWWDKCDTLNEMAELTSLFIAIFNQGHEIGLDDGHEAGFEEGYELALEENRYEGYQYDFGPNYDGVELRYKGEAN